MPAVGNTSIRRQPALGVDLNEPDFRNGIDRFGGVTGTISPNAFRTMTTLCELAGASDTAEHFEARFSNGGNASAEQRTVRDNIATLLSEQLGSACPPDVLHRFLRHFLIVRFDYLHEGAIDSAEAINSVRSALADSENAQAPSLWSALCRVAREGAGRSQQFSRASLVNLLSRTVRLRGAPSLRDNLRKLSELATTWVRDIDDDVRGTRLNRGSSHQNWRHYSRRIASFRFVAFPALENLFSSGAGSRSTSIGGRFSFSSPTVLREEAGHRLQRRWVCPVQIW
jgi:hypothetical protein